MSDDWRDHPAIRAMALPADLVAELDDDALLLALDGASTDDQLVLMAEIERRNLSC